MRRLSWCESVLVCVCECEEKMRHSYHGISSIIYTSREAHDDRLKLKTGGFLGVPFSLEPRSNPDAVVRGVLSSLRTRLPCKHRVRLLVFQNVRPYEICRSIRYDRSTSNGGLKTTAANDRSRKHSRGMTLWLTAAVRPLRFNRIYSNI
jgi:hypothetical protein